MAGNSTHVLAYGDGSSCFRHGLCSVGVRPVELFDALKIDEIYFAEDPEDIKRILSF